MSKTVFPLFPDGDVELFYSNSSCEARCIGHLRMDFGSGSEFWTTWWPHAAHAHNDAVFKAEFDALINQLRLKLFKNRTSMYAYLAEHPAQLLETGAVRSYGYRAQSKHYCYFIRCTPEPGNYNGYVYCYLTDCQRDEKE